MSEPATSEGASNGPGDGPGGAEGVTSARPNSDAHSTLWPTLLAKWTEFAKASVAFPKSAEGDAWRAAVPSIITVQAVAMALGELCERLEAAPSGASPQASPRPDRAEVGVALSKSGVLLDQHEQTLRGLWAGRGEPLPPGIEELISDARSAVEAVLLRAT